MDVKKILKEATDNGASDIFIVAGRPSHIQSKGVMECLNEIRRFQKKPLNLSHQSMLLPREIFQNLRKPEMMTFPSLYREYHVTE